MADIIPIILEDRDPWDQLSDEPKVWFERFDIFRLIGPERTIPKAYRKWRQMENRPIESTKATSHNWYGVAAKWRWEERANAWDEMRREEQDARAAEVYGDGLSFAHERVAKLKILAEKLESFLLDPKVTRVSPYLIEQYRGILDDIAKERGERAKETRITGATGGAIIIETQWGRGGSVSSAWEARQIEPPKDVVDAIVEEVQGDADE